MRPQTTGLISNVRYRSALKRSALQRGFTVLEMLLAMAILGIVLLVASALLQSNQAAASTQQARTTSLEDGRAAMSRIAETLSRAAYIYPSGITITVTSGLVGTGADKTNPTNSITTGADAVAMLLYDDKNASPRGYYGVIFYVTTRDKTKFASDLSSLPTDRIGQSVLVEARTTQTGAGPITWSVNANPALTSKAWSATMDEGVLADGVVSTSTNLMASAVFSPSGGVDDSVFTTGLRSKSPAMTLNTARILGVGYNLGVQIAPPGKTLASTGPTLLRGLSSARSVPRR
jgi:prepilin-type N-terminal cleavage/methylation domain-containing protein